MALVRHIEGDSVTRDLITDDEWAGYLSDADYVSGLISAAGYAVVPREPTEAMRKAAFGPILHGGRGGPMTADYVRQEAALTVYRAMIDSLNAATDRDIERAASEPTR